MRPSSLKNLGYVIPRMMALLVGIGLLTSSLGLAFERDEAKSSVDLSQSLSGKPKVLNVSKDWEFYWNVLIEPETALPSPDGYLNPEHSWNDAVLANGEKLGSYGRATYRKILKQLPYHPEGYELGTRGIYSAFKLIVYPLDHPEKAQVRASGSLNVDSTEGSRQTAYLRLHPAETTDYVVLLQVANYNYISGGPSWPVELAAGHRISAAVETEGFINIIGLGVMVAVGIYSTMMWVRRRSDLPALSLAVVSLAAFFRVGSTCPFIVMYLPEKLYPLIVKAEFFSMPMGVGSYLAFLISSFYNDQRSWSGRILLPFHAACIALTLATPVKFFTSFLAIYQLGIAVTGLVYLALLGQAVWQKKSGARLVLSGCVLIVFSFAFDIFASISQMQLILITPLAVMIFLILQSQLIALRAAETYERSERLASELVVKNEEITFFNKNLEKLVDFKTKEIRSLLDHIPQGVCTIGEDTLIQKDYSAQLCDVLGTQDIAGRTVKELLLDPSTLSADQKDQIVQTLLASIGESIFNFDTNADKLPREIPYVLNKETRYLKATWNTEIDGDDNVHRILLTLLDVTNEKALELKAQEQGRQLQMIRELLDASAEKLAQFFSTALPLLQENQKLLKQDTLETKTVRLLFVNAHTVKGAARTLQLRALADVIHTAEDFFSHVLKGQSVDPQVMREAHDKALAVLEQYLTINREKLNRKDDLSKVMIDRSFLESEYYMLRNVIEDRSLKVEHVLDILRHHSEALTQLIFDLLPSIFEGYSEKAAKIARDIGKPEPSFVMNMGPIPVSNEARTILDNCMVHILRNALDHGIETAEERQAKKKNPQGTIEIDAELKDGVLAIRVHDDGRGLAMDKIKQKGLALGQIKADASPDTIAQLIFASGLSTADKLSNISGRGVGMDAVKQFLEQIGGSVSIVLGAEKTEGYRDFSLHMNVPMQKLEQKVPKVA